MAPRGSKPKSTTGIVSSKDQTKEITLAPPRRRSSRVQTHQNDFEAKPNSTTETEKKPKRSVKHALKTEISSSSDQPKEVKRQTPKKENTPPETGSDVLSHNTAEVELPATLEGKRKRKRNTGYGFSPYPDYHRPTPQECEEVHRLLAEAHGRVKPRTGHMAPVRGRATCGDVELLLDALLRTLLSANTSNTNSNAAVTSLENTFPVPEGKNVTIDWAAVHEATQSKLADALACGGLQNVKAGYIKKTLQKVFDQNIQRRDALLAEQKTGVEADIPGVSTLSSEQKAAEIALISEDPFSLEWVRELETADVMETLIKFPGISFKTVSCAILFNLRRPAFAVDTHVHRMCKWLGWVPTGPDQPKDHPDKTFFHIDLHVPDHLKHALHVLFIRHGKKCYHCKANTSVGTTAWDAVVCPIEHLLTRKEPKKQPGYRPSASEAKKQMKELEEEDSADDIEELNGLKQEGNEETEGNDFEATLEPPKPKRMRKLDKSPLAKRVRNRAPK
ncbi:DNA-glycosylase [Glarea lozoyensis ATCC 20868]|uniref:DNA-glycosylase n=1 Tax=Glarea lozoyensis (strain ATCC 20868 / MF5171) TaxID=1116229 RepID=S3DJE6_GLAL2|nr:DNA-glycosylase [Glarea lozoyensis ATCC 20868]EPE26678.1 DNA-glycosylase [Glarea lozoyensis ATCC 20868]